MFGAIGFVWWVVAAFLLVWWMNYSTEIPVHDESRRYQELRQRPGEDAPTVVRSFRYKSNAMKWIRSREKFRGSLILLDSRGDKVIFERELN